MPRYLGGPGFSMRTEKEILGRTPRISKKDHDFFKECIKEKMQGLWSHRYKHDKGRWKGQWNFSKLAENINIVGIKASLAKKIVKEIEEEHKNTN